ncbi:Chk1 protein kinase [Kappamyces sp. JEL0829]|nr:Chk1 protein kinase [Kappamyces sp. JEL0829]
MLASPSASILGYNIGQELGQGANASVYLGSSSTGALVAIKVLDKSLPTFDVNAAKKEFKIHNSVSHQNIIRVFGCSENHENIFIVMEYAAAGELFDKIEPDVGVGEEVAHFYFRQLIGSVSYLHSLGVCHRDLKPENILLDECGNLKLSDFGLATVFMHKGSKRTLKTPCGSPPYLAPEIREMCYEGNQVDLWSCGIILFVMLVGNTAWAEPTAEDQEFMTFVHYYPQHVSRLKDWSTISPSVLVRRQRSPQELIIGLLNIEPTQRFTLDHIAASPWFQM